MTVVASFGILLWMTLSGNAAVSAWIVDDVPFSSFGGRCSNESQCYTEQTCVNNMCENACCGKTCGSLAGCLAFDHEATCYCPSGFTGDPNVLCQEIIIKTTAASFNQPEEERLPTVLPGLCGNVDDKVRSLRTALHDKSAQSYQFVRYFVTRCTLEERNNVSEAYSEKYDEDLFAAVKQRLAGNRNPTFRTVNLYLEAHNFSHYLAVVPGIESNFPDFDYSFFRTILTPIADDPEGATLSAYIQQQKWYVPLRDSLLSGPEKKLWNIIDTQISGSRSKSSTVDNTTAMEDAKKFLTAINSGSWLNDDNDFHDILLTKSYPHVQRVIKHYQRIGGYPLKVLIEKTFTELVADAYIEILQYAEDKYKYFAKKLRSALRGEGHSTLFIFVFVVWRAEKDLESIKVAYENRYKTSLYDDMKTNSGYRSVEKALIFGFMGESA